MGFRNECESLELPCSDIASRGLLTRLGLIWLLLAKHLQSRLAELQADSTLAGLALCDCGLSTSPHLLSSLFRSDSLPVPPPPTPHPLSFSLAPSLPRSLAPSLPRSSARSLPHSSIFGQQYDSQQTNRNQRPQNIKAETKDRAATAAESWACTPVTAHGAVCGALHAASHGQ